MLSEDEFDLIDAFDKQPRAKQLALFDAAPDAHAKLLLGLAARVNKDDALRYSIALINQMFKGKLNG